MPKEYNIAPWFSLAYKDRMNQLIAAIEETFAEVLSGEGPGIELVHCVEDGYTSDPIKPGEPLKWWGGEPNIGYNAIFTAYPSTLRRILPSYMRSSIEVLDRGESAAEGGMMPWALARALTCDPCDAEFFARKFDVYTPLELRIIRSVLDLISTRHDECAEAASQAIASYWHDYEPL